MQAELESSELVRCVGCRAIYEQVIASAESGPGAACPRCGEVGWLAAWIPVEETEAAVPA